MKPLISLMLVLIVLSSCTPPETTPKSDPPTLQNPGEQLSQLMDEVNLTIEVSETPYAVTFNAEGLPDGLEINSQTGTISGQATRADTYAVTVSVSGDGHLVEKSFDWIINTAPSITSPANQETLVNETAELQLVATDADEDTLSYSSSTLPTGLSIASSTGLITGTPTQVGTYAVTVTVADEHEGVTSASFSWNIKSLEPSPLVAHWTFDEGSGNKAMDSSGNNNTATIQNGGWGTGRVGGALEMNGGDDSIVTVPLSPSLRTTRDEITVMAWAYRTAEHNSAILSQTYPSIFFGFHKPRLFKWAMTNNLGQNSECYADKKYIAALNIWYHMVGTYDGSMLRLYVNGEEICNISLSGPRQMVEAPITLSGYDNPDLPIIDEITGKLDDVRIYNQALTAQEIKEIYDSF